MEIRNGNNSCLFCFLVYYMELSFLCTWGNISGESDLQCPMCLSENKKYIYFFLKKIPGPFSMAEVNILGWTSHEWFMIILLSHFYPLICPATLHLVLWDKNTSVAKIFPLIKPYYFLLLTINSFGNQRKLTIATATL